MICRNGHQNPDDGKFCAQCGESLPSATAGFPPPPGQPSVIVGEAEKPGKNKLIVVGGLVAAVVVVVGVLVAVLGGGSGESLTVRGTLSLQTPMDQILDEDPVFEGDWDTCYGVGGYDDIDAGNFISVRDGEQKLIGSSALENATASNLPDLVEMNEEIGWYGEIEGDSSAEDEIRKGLDELASIGGSCVLYFEVEVEKSDFYEFEIAKRDPLAYSHADLAKDGFVIALNLGGD